jgi:hypothetical protein
MNEQSDGTVLASHFPEMGSKPIASTREALAIRVAPGLDFH